MNLALIDPFQLAQDSPDALVDEFSKFPSLLSTSDETDLLRAKYLMKQWLIKTRIWTCHYPQIQSQR